AGGIHHDQIAVEPLEALETRGQVELLVVCKNHHRELLAYSPACGRVALQISRSHRCGTSPHSRSKSAATAAQSRGWKHVYRRWPGCAVERRARRTPAGVAPPGGIGTPAVRACARPRPGPRDPSGTRVLRRTVRAAAHQKGYAGNARRRPPARGETCSVVRRG